MTAGSIEIHVEELVLYGFPPEQRDRIGAAFERQLTRLVVSDGLPQSVAEIDEVAHLDGGTIGLMPGAGPEDTGAQIARAVYGGLGE